ncbi:hypothetical protein M8C21_022096, partial [Ambrosia artemisiifolia]
FLLQTPERSPKASSRFPTSCLGRSGSGDNRQICVEDTDRCVIGSRRMYKAMEKAIGETLPKYVKQIVPILKKENIY